MVRRVRSWWRRRPLLAWSVVGLVAAAALAVAVVPALADTLQLDVSGNDTGKSSTTWTLGGTQNPSTWSEALSDTDEPDGDSGYATANNRNVSLYLEMTNPSGGSGTINSVTVYIRARNTTGNEEIGIGISDTVTDVDSTLTYYQPGSSYTQYSQSFTTDSGGGAWDWTDIDNLQVHLRTAGNGGWSGEIRVTEVYAVVDYTPAAPDEITIASANQPAAAYVARSTAYAVDGFTLQHTSGSGSPTVTGITVTDSGTTPASTVSAVRVYRDDGDNTYDGGDTLLNSTAATFSGSTATVTFDSAESVGSTAQQYWVVYTVAGGAGDAATMDSQVTGVSHTADSLVNNAVQGNTFTVDASNPTVNTSDPSSDTTLTSATQYTISGTASDSGSGVSSVEVQIQRSSDSWYWNGGTSSWQSGAVWNSASGTTNWTYTWDFSPTSQDGSPAYTITARATDGVGNTGTDATPSTNVRIDNTGPSVVSASPVDSTHVDVVFSEQLDGASLDTSDFSFAPSLGTVTGVSLQPDGITVRVTHSNNQVPGTSYTVTVTAGSVTDVAGNGSKGAPDNDATFTGYGEELTAASANQPAAGYVGQGDTDVLVDGFTLQRTAGSQNVNVTGVTIRNTGTSPSTNVSAVYVWRDDGDNTFDPGDTQLNSAGATFSGTDATVAFDSTEVIGGTAVQYWVTYDFAAGATDGAVARSLLFGVSHDAELLTNNAVAGNDFTVDAQAPTANTTDPSTDDTITTSPKTISGTASDSGSGVASVEVRIQRASDSWYWNGGTSSWQSGEVWNSAAGTTNWTYNFAWGSADGERITVTARATDNVGLTGTDATPSSNVVLDNTGPSVTGAVAVSATEVDVTFSEDVDAASLDTSDFSFAPSLGTVTGVSLQASNTVRVTHSTAQTPGQSYTVTVAAGSVNDLVGNGSKGAPDNDATFTGYGLAATTLTVASANQPAAATVTRGQTDVVVDGFTMQRTGGLSTVSVSEVVINDSGTTPGSTVSGVHVWRDDGDNAFDAGDTNLNASAATFTGSDATVTFDSAETIGATAVQYWVTYNIAAGAAHNATADSRITGVTHDADNLDTTGVSRGNTFTVDAEGPKVQSATAVDSTHVDVRFTEELDGTTVQASDFSIDGGLSVTAAVLQGDNKTVRLTNNPDQTGSTVYTVTVTLGSIDDLYGNPNVAPNTAQFTGAAPADSQPPSVPQNVVAATGTVEPVIATVTWDASTDNVGVAGYKVYRSIYPGGPYEMIASIAATPSPTFQDTDGVPGQEYYYKVRAYDAAGNESGLSDYAGPVRASWTRAPHASYGASTALCDYCHDPHLAATQENIFRDVGVEKGELALCYSCHDGTGAATNVKTGPSNSFAMSSGHSLEETTTSPDLTNECSSCHSPHKDYTTRPGLYRSDINSDTVTSTGNGWCFACHNDAQDWYDGSYPSASSPTRDASGYPAAGVYPGETTYSSWSANPHSRIPTTAAGQSFGDCRHCHGTHRESNSYDMLDLTFRPSTAGTVMDDRQNGTYAESCFECHGGAVASGFTTAPVDIKRHVTYDWANDSAYSGHRIKTAGGNLPVNAPLPCYDCHNPHGSTRGNAYLISDTLGGSLDTSSAAGVRRFCFTCHSTADTTEGWDSDTSTYVSVTGQTVEGLERDGSDSSKLNLPSVNGHNKGDSQSCYTCHGNDYSAASSNNVHNPSPGLSNGGTSCYNCHSTYQTYMEDNAGSKTGGPERLTVYHHVLGGSGVDGDQAPSTGTYPTSLTDVYCVSCHTDHNYFNSSKAANLRQNIANNDGSVTSNTDYLTASPYGICVSCHSTIKSKDTANQKDDGTTTTQKIDGALFDASTHEYSVESTFGAGNSFYANCSKCHNDEQGKSFQTGVYGFSTHYSAERRIVSAFGASVNDPMNEDFCYNCHSRATDPIPRQKPVNGKDAYGALGSNMTGSSEYVYEMFEQTLGSSHPVSATVTGSVECVNCHNPHTVSSSVKVSDPDNTYNPLTHSTVDQKVSFCLRCHDGSPPAYQSNATTYVPSAVTMAPANLAQDNKSTYQSRGHWSASGSISSGERVACWVCHDNHGSVAPKLLGQYDFPSGQNWIGSTSISANNNTVCSDSGCHGNASTSFPDASRTASGYPTDGTWPGFATYNTAYNPVTHTGSVHTTTTAVWPGKSYAGGDCKNCHDVHGTANTYDQLRTEDSGGTHGVYGFGPSDMTFCFNCHDDDGPALSQGALGREGDIKQYYPASSGGTNSGPRAGHQISTSGGNLPVGTGLPCYDCHNPHGSASEYALQLTIEWSVGTTTTLGDQAGEIDLSDASGVREFCFGCHTTSDTGTGWDGSGYTDATGTSFEGLDRQSGKLGLPSVNGHSEFDTQSCFNCHGRSYADANSNNVHNPSGGVSAGGQDCYTCHGTYQTNMEDGTGSKTGSNRTASYHHVLGSATNDGDKAFAAGSYPGAGTDVYCLSCHVDHDKFNSSKGSNLRASTAADPAGSNTDFPGGGTYGICVGCHSVSRAKDTTNQKDDGFSSSTPIIAGADFDVSAHDYTVSSEFGSGNTFNANCSKCHNDEQTKDFQTSTYKFGTHWSAEQRILSALGASLADPMGEDFCFSCHSRSGDSYKSTDGYDYYGTAGASMASGAEYVYQNFASKTSSHPVEASGGNSVECSNCHNPHEVRATVKLNDPDNTYNSDSFADTASQAEFCLTCHDGSTPSYVANGTTYIPRDVTIAAADASAMNKSTYASEGHWTAHDSISVGEVQSCAVCHDKHGSNAPKLLGTWDSAADENVITYGGSDTTITANNNTVCQACHDSASTNFPGGESQRDGATGYLTHGTWPGFTRYNTAYNPVTKTGSMHTTTTAVWPGKSYSGGDCKNCHDVHGTANAWDALRTEDDGVPPTHGVYGFSATDVSFCFNCHDADGPAQMNIQQFASAGGHKIKTSGGYLPVGAIVPCYDCHNPHGSASAYGLQVREFGDSAGEITIQARGASRQAADVRKFCLLCHSTSDGKVWDPASSSYQNVGTDTVEGLRRDGSDGSVLAVPGGQTGHASTDTQSCTACHGEDYSTATSNNVHNPGAGVSNGGLDCYTCHTTYQAYMEDGSGSKTGANRASVYHHVLGGALGDGDKAFADGSLPTSQDDVYCMSCHTDHDAFNSQKAWNLRDQITNVNKTPAASWDATSSSPYGVCLTCHGSVRTKQSPGTDMKDDGFSVRTPKLTAADYFAAAASHDYAVQSVFGSTDTSGTFYANCSKCHNDEQSKDFQTGTYSFSVHYSANRRILAALGATVAEDYGEGFCYRCHSYSSDAVGGTKKTVDGRDWYGNAGAAMSADAQAVYRNFQLAGSKHPVVAAGGNSVECANCHNPHEVGNSTTLVVSDPDNIYNNHAYDTVANKVAFCLTCHDDPTNLPTYTVAADGSTWIPSTVTIAVADQGIMDKDTYASEAHWTAHDSISSGEVVACGDCHDNHGSDAPKLLGVYDSSDDNNYIGTQQITANNNTVCQGCHDSASAAYPGGESNRDATTGYLTDGTWPGWTVWNTAYNSSQHTGNGHSDSGVVWPGKSYSGGDCKNCHDPHGTANAWDMLRTEDSGGTHGVYGFEKTDLTFCFNCHDGSPAATDIKSLYPAAVGGTSSGTNAGHRVLSDTSGLSGNTLSQNDSVPCYDCHNPHGGANGEPYMLAANGVNDFNDAGTDAGMRRFCFSCHATSDTTKGWDGTSYVSVSGLEVEGIPRDSSSYKLLLPAKTEHTESDGTNCLDCHSDPHEPTGGISNGGADCYACHADYLVMEDNTGSQTGGAGRLTYYHHVLGSATNDGDKAFAAGSYPGAGTDVYCLSCHVDHDKFNSSKASNLRDGTGANPNASNQDFPGGGTYGICIGCHSTARTKDTANQASSYGSQQTPAISGADYDSSKHDFAATSTYNDATTFNANCSKCHSDEQAKSKQTSTNKFGTHYSAESRILAAMGVTVPAEDQTEEDLCFKCHSTTNNPNAGSGMDYYNTASMSARALGIETQMGQTSKHDVNSYAGKHRADEYTLAPTGVTSTGWWNDTGTGVHIECEDCHNVHAVQQSSYVFENGPSATTSNRSVTTGSRGSSAPSISNANKGVWGVTITGPNNSSSGGDWAGSQSSQGGGNPQAINYAKAATASYEWQLCLKCHSRYAWGSGGSPPNVPSGATKVTGTAGTSTSRATVAMKDVGSTFDPANYAIHPVFTTGFNQPSTNLNGNWDTLGGRRSIGGATTGFGLTNTFVDGWSTTSRVTCSDCHNNDSWSASESSGPHGSSNPWLLRGVNTGIKVTIADTDKKGNDLHTVTTPNTGLALTSNFCVNCHRSDVYGDGDAGEAAYGGSNASRASDFEALSRVSHLGGGLRTNCDGWTGYLQHLPTGCYNCHGARDNDNGTATANIHGSSMGRGDGDNSGAGNLLQDGTLTGDEMGKRFMNGASWDAHLLAQSSGNAGCSTINTADSYSACTHHSGTWGQNATPNYYY
ncbi:MAG: hypothetical protein Kow0056_12330 [Coriobacteriia bacterium]